MIPANKSGLAAVKLKIPALVPKGTTLWWQTITWDPKNPKFPLEVSNRVKSQVVR